MNVLILSVGRRNKIVQYFKESVGNLGKVIAADASELAPALYTADKYYIVPEINEPHYIDAILNICIDNNVNAVLSLIDPELSIISKNKHKFHDIGVVPIVSDYDEINLCFDKYRMYEFLVDNNIKTIKSYINLNKFYKDLEENKIQFPVFVKPIKGSASININKVNNLQQLESLFSNYDNLMVQEYMNGQEYGADVYVDLISREVVSIFVKEKITMRSGETDKSKSLKNNKMFDFITKFINLTGLLGVLDIDIFEKNGEFYISEVNPRFGGGYPHAHESGVNIPEMIINNIFHDEVNDNVIGQYSEDTFMLKYTEVEVIKKI